MFMRSKLRRYGKRMTVMIVMIIIVIMIWRKQDFTKKLQGSFSLQMLGDDSNEQEFSGNVWDKYNQRKDGLSKYEFHWLKARAKAGGMSGVFNKHNQWPSAQRLCPTAEEIILILKQLISEIIDLRVSLDEKHADVMEEKYAVLQAMLQKMEQNAGKSQGSKESKSQLKPISDICAEKRETGKKRKGFERNNCTKPHLSNAVSVIIDHPYQANASRVALVDEIQLHHKGIKVLSVDANDDREGRTTRAYQINQLVAEIKTPFVYLSRNLKSMVANADLQRQIDVITSIPKAVAIGSAIVNISNGHWSHGCTQMRLRNYVLRYERGYYTSLNSCIKCDALDGPLLVKTDFLQRNNFNVVLNHGYYEDWFLRIRGYSWKDNSPQRGRSEGIRVRNGDTPLGLIYSCPDVTNVVAIPEIDSLRMAKMTDLWDIKKIIHSNGKSFWFGCKSILLKQAGKCHVGRGMSVPPCCLHNLVTAIQFIMRKCSEYKIACELMEGTLLGALKFQNVLPWERDADIAFYAGDFDRLILMAGDLEERGYNFTVRGRNENSRKFSYLR